MLQQRQICLSISNLLFDTNHNRNDNLQSFCIGDAMVMSQTNVTTIKIPGRLQLFRPQ